MQVVQVYIAILHEYNLSKLFWHFVSSIVNEAIKTISSQFFLFFLREDFEPTKSTKTQNKRFPPS